MALVDVGITVDLVGCVGLDWLFWESLIIFDGFSPSLSSVFV